MTVCFPPFVTPAQAGGHMRKASPVPQGCRHPRASEGPHVQDVSGAARASSPPRKRGATCARRLRCRKGVVTLAQAGGRYAASCLGSRFRGNDEEGAGMTNEGAGMTGCSNLERSNLERSNLERSNLGRSNARTLKPRTLKPRALGPRTLKPRALGPRTLKPRALGRLDAGRRTPDAINGATGPSGRPRHAPIGEGSASGKCRSLASSGTKRPLSSTFQ